MKLRGISIPTNSIPSCFSPERKDEEMPEYDTGWEGAAATGAFPSSRDDPSRPMTNSSDGDDRDHIFVDDAFDTGAFGTIENINAAAREEIVNSSHDGLMAVSHCSSSETPATNNTTTAVIRDALKKSKELHKSGAGSQGGNVGFYPYNMFHSLSKGKGVGQETKETVARKSKGVEAATASDRQQNADNRDKNREQPATTAHQDILTPLPAAMEDEPSSVITDDQHDHHHNQYVYDYMAEGASVQPPMSVMSVRSNHQRHSKSHLARHTLPTKQQVTANPAYMLKNLFISIEEERHMRRLTAQNLRAIHNWLLFLPSILLTLIGGLLVLVFEADLKYTNESSRVYSSVAVGTICLVSVFWQAVYKQLDFGVQSALHDACAVALKRLSEDILLTLSSATEIIPAEYVALIGEKYGQAVDACSPSSNIPYKLEAAFSALSDRMILMLRPPVGRAPHKHINKLDLIRLYATAYDELSAEVINYNGFPFVFPDPRHASEAALRNFKTIITEGKEVDRRYNRCMKNLCLCFGSPDEERSLFDILPTAAAVGAAYIEPTQLSI